MALPSLDSAEVTPSAGDDRRQTAEPRRNEEHRDIYEAGLQAGIAQGRHEGAVDARQRCEDEARASAQAAGGFAAERLNSIVESFEARFALMEADLADKAIDLGTLIASRILATELSVNRQAMTPVIRECLNTLGRESRDAVLHLNPADFELLDPAIVTLVEQWPVKIEVDVSVTPGGCMLETPHSVVDGTLETRWQRALSAIGLDSDAPPETLQ